MLIFAEIPKSAKYSSDFDARKKNLEKGFTKISNHDQMFLMKKTDRKKIFIIHEIHAFEVKGKHKFTYSIVIPFVAQFFSLFFLQHKIATTKRGIEKSLGDE